MNPEMMMEMMNSDIAKEMAPKMMPFETVQFFVSIREQDLYTVILIRVFLKMTILPMKSMSQARWRGIGFQWVFGELVLYGRGNLGTHCRQGDEIACVLTKAHILQTPSTFNQSVVLFLSVGLGVGIFFYYITKAIVTLIAPMACMLFILYIVGLHKYPVYIYRGGFYFNRIYTWRGFDGCERVGDSIKLIGKKWVSPNVYLKDKDGKVEEILKKYFSH